MNFLQLCQDLAREAGISTTGPSDVVSQTGDYLRVVNWIKRADMAIQRMPVNWNFMWDEATIKTVVGKRDYNPANATIAGGAGTLKRWVLEDGRCYLESDGVSEEYKIRFLKWGKFRPEFMYGSQSNSKPGCYTILPNGKMRLQAPADDVYVISSGGYLEPIELSVSTDTPRYPDEYHIACLYLAMTYYAKYEEAEDIRVQYQDLYEDVLYELKQNQLTNHTLKIRPIA